VTQFVVAKRTNLVGKQAAIEGAMSEIPNSLIRHFCPAIAIAGHRHASFRSLLDVAAGHQPLIHKMLISPEATA
jgi:hypothetical protein